MKDVRCGTCNKLLCRGDYKVLQIKCGRCHTLNDLRAMSPQPERPECHFLSEKNG
ncbi:Com family DNA-binding transcriptional regulator [Limnohabitans sp.]|nr:Com family DNA-binding transcriptional regulator [Limnohabitans sp.]